MSTRTPLLDAVTRLRTAARHGADAFEGADFQHAARLLHDGVETFLAAWDTEMAGAGREVLTQIADLNLLLALGAQFEQMDRAAGLSAQGELTGVGRTLTSTAEPEGGAAGHRWQSPPVGQVLFAGDPFIGDQVCARCGLWIDYTGVAPAFYHPDGRQADGDENTCDGPAGAAITNHHDSKE